MGLFDLPVSELYSYKGTNPKPDDFDLYWERGLAEIDRIDPQVSLTSAYSHTMFNCYDLYYTGTRNARVYAKFIIPKHTDQPIPAVFQFHGYSGSSGDWTGLMQIAASGYAVAAMDVRGQGGKSEDTGGVKGNTYHGHVIRGIEDDDPDALLFRNIYLDTALLVKIVSGFKKVDPLRLAVCGGSQGGGLALACAALSPVKLAAVYYPFLCDYQRVWDLDLAVDAYLELKEYFRNYDPMHHRKIEFFTKLGYIDVQHLTDRITGEVQMYTGLMDTVCPPSTQFAAYNKIKTKKQVLFYPDFGHEGLPGVMDDIVTFFMKKL